MKSPEISWEPVLDLIRKAPVVRRPRGNPGSAPHGLYYKDVICSFDIETSKVDEKNSIMYSWQFCCEDADHVIIGRSWEEFIEFSKKVKEASRGAAIAVYVHDLAHEFVYLSGLMRFESKDVLSGKKREVIKAYSEPFEFRCSYRLTGLSLESLTHRLKVKHPKIKGYDYNKVRYPWTELESDELEYIKNDVIGLVEAVKILFAAYEDNIYKVPITQTGYIRRVIKKVMRSYPWGRIAEQKINYEIYQLCYMAMRGGLVHANRYLAGEVISDIEPWDMSSCYPAAMIYCCYPMGAWQIENNPDISYLLRLIYKRKKAILATIRFTNLRLKNKYDPWPYITKNKSAIKGACQVDNGRVMKAQELTGTYTDIDFKIILSQYDFDEITILQMASSTYGKLPEQIRNEIKKLYRDKTALKGVDPVGYELTKILLNGCFGMMSEDPGKLYTYYNPDTGEFQLEELTREQALERKNKNSFLSYAWGVWVTAHARAWMQGVLSRTGEEGALYVDTDGVKVYKGQKYIFEEFNAKIEKMALSEGGCQAIDADGVIHTLGEFEREPVMDEFITLGAKKYAYKRGNKIEIATSGVNKEKGGEELGSLENYKEGFTFRKGGGSEAIYNDHVDKWIEIDGHKVHITRNVSINPSTYTLGLTSEYKRLILMPEIVLSFIRMQKGAKNEEIS